MNTKVKVGIAAVIVAALAALIVLDQKTAPPSEAAKGGASSEEATLLTAPPVTPDAAAPRLREEEVRTLIDQSRRQFGGPGGPSPAAPTPAPAGPKKGDEPPPGKEIRPVAEEEYVIQEGDTFESIAERKYGSRAYVSLLVKANPSVKPTALRVGRKIVVPPKPEDAARAETPKVAEPSPAAARTPEPAASPAQADPAAAGPRTYVVQPGDTLSGISLKLYNTSRHWEKLYEANRDKISDPGVMVVGTKLTVPDLPVKAGPATGGGAVPTAAAAPAGARVHQVQPNDSLWKIAEKYAGDRGVLEMIEAILKANPDKLKDEKSLLRVGWSLVIPE